VTQDSQEQDSEKEAREAATEGEGRSAPVPDQVFEELSRALSQAAALFTPEGAPEAPQPRNPAARLLLGRVRRRLYAEFNAYLSQIVELLLNAIRLTERLGEARLAEFEDLREAHRELQKAHWDLWDNYVATKQDLYKEVEELKKRANKCEIDIEHVYEKAILAIRFREMVKKDRSSSQRDIFERYAELTPDCYVGFDVLPDQAWRREQILELTLPPAVEVGCSDGGITAYLNQNGKMTVGLDIAVTYLASARKPGLYVGGDGRALPFLTDSFETVILAEILEHVTEPRKFIREALRVARRRLVVTIPESMPDPTHLWEIAPAELPSILRSEFGLRIVEEKKHGDFWVWAADIS